MSETLMTSTQVHNYRQVLTLDAAVASNGRSISWLADGVRAEIERYLSENPDRVQQGPVRVWIEIHAHGPSTPLTARSRRQRNCRDCNPG